MIPSRGQSSRKREVGWKVFKLASGLKFSPQQNNGGKVHATRTTEVLTVGNSAQPPPTGTSDGSIDLGVGLKTTPSCALPLPRHRCFPALFLFHPWRFCRVLDGQAAAPLFTLYSAAETWPKVDQLSRYCFIPPFPFRVFTAPRRSCYYLFFLVVPPPPTTP